MCVPGRIYIYIYHLKTLTERGEGISIIAVCYTPYFVLLLLLFQSQKGNLAKELSVRFLQLSVGKRCKPVTATLSGIQHSTEKTVWIQAALPPENSCQQQESVVLSSCSSGKPSTRKGECGSGQLFPRKTAVSNKTRRVWISNSSWKLATLPENGQQRGQCEFRQLHV